MLNLHTSQIELDQLLGDEKLEPTRRNFLRALQCRVSDYLDPDFPHNESAQELAFDLAFVITPTRLAKERWCALHSHQKNPNCYRD